MNIDEYAIQNYRELNDLKNTFERHLHSGRWEKAYTHLLANSKVFKENFGKRTDIALITYSIINGVARLAERKIEWLPTMIEELGLHAKWYEETSWYARVCKKTDNLTKNPSEGYDNGGWGKWDNKIKLARYMQSYHRNSKLDLV